MGEGGEFFYQGRGGRRKSDSSTCHLDRAEGLSDINSGEKGSCIVSWERVLYDLSTPPQLI